MTGRWQIEIFSSEGVTPDGGGVSTVSARHLGTGFALAGNLVEYEGEKAFVDELTANDLAVNSAAARRLVLKMYQEFGRSTRAFADSGTITQVVLYDFIDDHYNGDGAVLMKALIEHGLNLLVKWVAENFI